MARVQNHQSTWFTLFHKVHPEIICSCLSEFGPERHITLFCPGACCTGISFERVSDRAVSPAE